MKAIECSGKCCHEVFQIYENYEPGGINDNGYLAVKCIKCGAITKFRMMNPPTCGIFKNFEIIAAWEDGDNNPYESMPEGETAHVLGNGPAEGKPIDFHPNLNYPLWENNEINLESYADNYFKSISSLVNGTLKMLYNGWVKSMPVYSDVQRCIVTQEYEHNGQTYKATWGKELKYDTSFCAKHFHLIEHAKNHKHIDGVYSRNEMMVYLSRLLMRWRLIANQVVVVTPFIGFDLPYSKEEDWAELIDLWELLNCMLDLERTTFITRVKTYGSLKKCQKKLGVPVNVLKKWDLMNNLQKMVNNPQTRVKPTAQFHAKFYAGIFDDHVEMLSGSFNVQTGDVLEQMHLREITKDLFKTNYMDRLVNGFMYEQTYNPWTWFVDVNKDGKETTRVAKLKDKKDK